MDGLILSIFPGIDILGKAFEEEGFCVVRGPDKLWGGDIHLFHPPAGVFLGIIGGPPCQEFSILQKMNHGKPGKWGNLIPEFERVVREAQPEWFVMENVKRAPLPVVEGYCIDPTILNNQWLGGKQHRVHRFSFGTKDSLNLLYDISLFESLEWAPRVMASGVVKDFQHLKGNKNMHLHGYRSNKNLRICLALQGLPENYLDDAPFTVDGKFGVVGNAVPLPMARALAKAVKKATEAKATVI